MSVSQRVNVKPDLLQRIERAFNESSYWDAIGTSSHFNTWLIAERTSRLPFIDPQTGVAQSNCSLWMESWGRMPGLNQGQIYSYPSKRWRKIRRSYLLNDSYLRLIRDTQESRPMGNLNVNCASATVGGDGLIKPENGDCLERITSSDGKETWYQDYDEATEVAETNDIEDPIDSNEDDDYAAGKKKYRKKTYAKRKKASEYTDAEKPYICDYCGMKYKTRPGLSYHYAHSHANGANDQTVVNNNHNSGNNSSGKSSGMEEERIDYNLPMQNTGINSGPPHHQRSTQLSSHSQGSSSQPKGLPPNHHIPSPNNSYGMVFNQVPGGENMDSHMLPQTGHHYHPHHHNSPQHPSIGYPEPHLPDSMPSLLHSVQNGSANTSTSSSGSSTTQSSSSHAETKDGDEGDETDEGRAFPNKYCDFCLGDSEDNKKTRFAEKMISCSDCGRSAHPSCLQFTPTMIISAQKYRWQCIECKSCGLCGTSDNDDQLLFCDDCDRGYHMYCLSPPLSEPPEGSWSCHLCIVEFHSKPGKSSKKAFRG